MSLPTTAKPQAFRLYIQLESYDGDKDPFAGRKYRITSQGKTVAEDQTTAAGEVIQDLPGDFYLGELRLFGNATDLVIPLSRWPIPPTPGPGAPGPGGSGDGGGGDDDPQGIILPGPDASSVEIERSRRAQEQAQAQAKADAAAKRKQASEAEQKKNDEDVMWNELGCRLHNLGFFSDRYIVAFPPIMGLNSLIRAGARNYCDVRHVPYPTDFGPDDQKTKDLLDALRKEHEGTP